MKKYKPKLFPIPPVDPQLKIARALALNLRWIWGGEKYGYSRLRDWPNGIGNPKRTDWIFPRGDLVWVGEDRESQEPQKKRYSRVYNFFRNQTGWVRTEDLMNEHPLIMLAKELEGETGDTDLEKGLDEKSCTNGACAIQNWLREKAMKHVKKIDMAETLRKDGDCAQKHIKYYKNTQGKRIIDINKAPVWPGDLLIFGNPEKAGFRSDCLDVTVLKDPNDKEFAPMLYIGWSGHTATIAKLYADNGTITHVDLIEAHTGDLKTEGTKYSVNDVHYWGVINWGFVATTTRSTELGHWDKIWENWWFYHYFVYALLTKQLEKLGLEYKEKKEDYPEEDWWYYKEIKETHHTDQMMKEKADEEFRLANDLLAKECRKRGRSPIDVNSYRALRSPKCDSTLDVYGFAYWVEPKSPS